MILATLEEGLRHHRAGRLARAAELYRHVLSADPSQPDALHLLGMAAFVEGRAAEARDLVGRAIRPSRMSPSSMRTWVSSSSRFVIGTVRKPATAGRSS